MSTPFLGEIRMVGFNFPPQGWLTCNGSLQSIADNDALYALLGTTYGGDGQTTFGVPDLRSRVPIHQGTGADGTNYTLGQLLGSENVQINGNTLGSHTHPFQASGAPGGTLGPAGANPASQLPVSFYSVDTTPSNLVPLAPNGTTPVGGNQPHNNVMPYQCLNYIIASEGIFPTQS